MNKSLITPGYVWHEVPSGLVLPDDTLQPIDLKVMYPVNDAELLQDIWDNRETKTAARPNGTEITTTTFNKNAENGAIFWLPGWGVSNLEGGGARVATLMAALNPDKRVVAAEELANVTDKHKNSAAIGDMGPYASNYMAVIEGKGFDVLSGHSRGGLIQTLLAGRADIGKLSVVNLMDMPRARSYLTALGFGARVGLLDNMVQGKYKELVDIEEEAVISSFGEISAGGGPKEAFNKAKDEWWLIKAMARSGLNRIITKAFLNQPTANFYLWQGTENVGVSVESTRAMVSGLRHPSAYANSKHLRYFEAPTGHYSEGHTARYARQTTFAIAQSRNN
ncbi:MAG: hypothetical protein Q7T41_03730 [Candidatus Saccharibacteria bacterium]|nr:hypothetical protein [Candidatus Saccharibacteria bacterium]